MTRQQRNRAARQAVLVALGVIVAFALFGQKLLDYMHITLPALQASGGLLLLLIAMELLTGKMEEPQPSGNGKVNVALVPLGTPLLAGPGAIVATMVFVQQSDKTARRLGGDRARRRRRARLASTWRCGSPTSSTASWATPARSWSPGSPACCSPRSRSSSSPTR